MAWQVSGGIYKMPAMVATYPTLGQMTQLTTPQTNISCVLDVESEYVHEDWRVIFRYALISTHEWKENDLRHAQANLFHAQGHKHTARNQILFEADIHITDAITFHFKITRGSEESWIVATEDPKLDSIILPPYRIQSCKNSRHINDYILHLNPDLRVRPLISESESRGIDLWIVEALVEPAQGENAHMTQVMFGKPFGGNFSR